MNAVGIHVFAGAMSSGVNRVIPVDTQLEVHSLGQRTVPEVFGIPVHCSRCEDWPDLQGSFAFGNPRCTAFSSLTGGLSRDSHGAFAKQTVDARQFCEYSAGRFDVCAWESVQQAYTTGKPFLDEMTRLYFAPKGYRVCHVLINYAAFGGSQHRKRYFYVAYRDGLTFNVDPPAIQSAYHATLWDSIGHWREDPGTEWDPQSSSDCPPDGYVKLTEDEKHVLPKLPTGWSLNALAAYNYDALTQKQKAVFDRKRSNKPFSLHCVRRLAWCTWSPTVHSGVRRWIHPEQNRPLTLREVCLIAGWPMGVYPVGPEPFEQIAKGVCPDAGEWIAQQAQKCLQGQWPDDWASRYDPDEATWVGDITRGQEQKTFDLTQYYARGYDIERFPDEITYSTKLFNVRGDGKLDKPWRDITKRYWDDVPVVH